MAAESASASRLRFGCTDKAIIYFYVPTAQKLDLFRFPNQSPRLGGGFDWVWVKPEYVASGREERRSDLKK